MEMFTWTDWLAMSLIKIVPLKEGSSVCSGPHGVNNKAEKKMSQWMEVVPLIISESFALINVLTVAPRQVHNCTSSGAFILWHLSCVQCMQLHLSGLCSCAFEKWWARCVEARSPLCVHDSRCPSGKSPVFALHSVTTAVASLPLLLLLKPSSIRKLPEWVWDGGGERERIWMHARRITALLVLCVR